MLKIIKFDFNTVYISLAVLFELINVLIEFEKVLEGSFSNVPRLIMDVER